MNLGSRYLSGGCGCGDSNARHTSHCDNRKIKSISRIGDDVLVTFNDCTFMTAPSTVVDAASMCGDRGTGNTDNNGGTPAPDNNGTPSGGNNVIMSLGGEIIDSAA